MKIDEKNVNGILFIELIYVDNHVYWLKNNSRLVWRDYFCYYTFKFRLMLCNSYALYQRYIQEVWNKLL